jgi:hypothetical protein
MARAVGPARRFTRLAGALGVLAIATGSAVGACNGEEAVEGSTSLAGTSAGHGDGSDDDDGPEPHSCEEGCASPPSDCHAETGTCEDGSCRYAPKLAGEVCDEGCVGGGFCDATGSCICTNDACDVTCTAGPNATATCDDDGECIRGCEAPWENCDGDWSNGCEVPVGVTGVCDLGGLNLDGGCWTAYCGQSDGPDTHDFGTYYCVSCSTCNVPAAGMCRWCNRETGNWYAAESCSCSDEHLDLACAP